MGTKSLSAPPLGAHSLRTNGPAQSGVHDDRKPGFHFWSHTDKPSASSSPHGLQLLAGPLPPAERPLLSSASGQSHLPSTPALAPPCPSHPATPLAPPAMPHASETRGRKLAANAILIVLVCTFWGGPICLMLGVLGLKIHPFQPQNSLQNKPCPRLLCPSQARYHWQSFEFSEP